MKNKKIFLLIVSALVLGGLSANAEVVVPEKMGVQFGVDSSQASGRTFARKLFHKKGTWGLGLQGTYLSTKGSNSSVLMLVTGLNGGISYGHIAPTVTYTYAHNLTGGVRFTYTAADGVVDQGLLDLMNEGLSFPLSGLNVSMRSLGVSVFHRYAFGLDDKGRFALLLDGVLSANRSKMVSGGHTLSNRYSFTVCPGFEAFVMNFLSLHLSLGLASVYFVDSKVYDASGSHIGGNREWKAGTGLSLMDLYFGLTFYL